MSDARKLAQAKRCALLIGSFEGAKWPCPCHGPGECPLTKEERETYREHPKVAKRRRQNLIDFLAQDDETDDADN